MPNIKSAVKRVKTIQKRTLRNARLKSTLRTTIRHFDEALTSLDKEDAQLKLKNATRALDKAVTKGILHKKTASRKKSRLTKRLNKAMIS